MRHVPRSGSSPARPARSGTVRPGTIGPAGPGRPGTSGGSVSASSRMLAWLLDDMFRIPGTRVGIGLDALIGLVPGIGDSIGAVLSTFILVDAVRNRVPMSVLARMGWNLLFDAVLGLVPGVGDIADAAHRANAKNLRLLEDTVARGRRVDASAKGYAVRAGLLVALILAVVVALAGLAVWGLLKLLRVA